MFFAPTSQRTGQQSLPGRIGTSILLAAFVLALTLPSTALASSHREAPSITETPQIDGTDFYMFRSYEPGREGYVTLIANYNPLQDPFGGPNYFPLDQDAFYDIHISNDGNPDADITFRFRFAQISPFASLQVGEGSSVETVPVPLVNIGPFGPPFGIANLNVLRSYTVRVVRGPMDNPASVDFLTRSGTNTARFGMPFDNIGQKSIPNYAAYANRFIFDTDIPGCSAPGRIFVGQRKESFAVNLGETFDLVNINNPIGDPDAESNDLAEKNITTLALEVPTDCLTASSSVIGGWTSAHLPRVRTLVANPTFDQPDRQVGPYMQVSRLGNPLVNEVAIGLPDKNLFNASVPADDAQFLKYVTHPTLPELLEILFGVEAPNNFPRNDLVAVFLTGIDGVNADGSVGEMMRLNTAIPPTARGAQQSLGVLAGDNAGYPNGRRPGDDVVDISLRAVMGVLCQIGIECEPADAPSGNLPFTDGTLQSANMFINAFPYLTTPLPGSPQP